MCSFSYSFSYDVASIKWFCPIKFKCHTSFNSLELVKYARRHCCPITCIQYGFIHQVIIFLPDSDDHLTALYEEAIPSMFMEMLGAFEVGSEINPMKL